MPESAESISQGMRMVIVQVAADRGLTPLAWLQANAMQTDAQVEPATLGERTGAGALIGTTGDTYALALAARGWIYQIERPFFGSPDQELERILATLRILDDATIGRSPVVTPTPRTIESVVDSISDGFRKKDVAAIADATAPCVSVGVVPGHPSLLSRTAYLNSLAADFAAGASVAVQSRPIEDDPNVGRFVRSIWSKPGEPDQRVDLLVRAESDRWSLVSVLIRTPGY